MYLDESHWVRVSVCGLIREVMYVCMWEGANEGPGVVLCALFVFLSIESFAILTSLSSSGSSGSQCSYRVN